MIDVQGLVNNIYNDRDKLMELARDLDSVTDSETISYLAKIIVKNELMIIHSGLVDRIIQYFLFDGDQKSFLSWGIDKSPKVAHNIFRAGIGWMATGKDTGGEGAGGWNKEELGIFLESAIVVGFNPAEKLYA